MNARIMVVEDEGITAWDIERRLLRLGYEVPAVVSSGEEAIVRAGESLPDLVLMDVRLSGELDGIETAQRLRRDFGIPVTFLTAFADDSTIARAQTSQPYGYLVKPFEERELHATIQMALQRCRLEKDLRRQKAWIEGILGSVRDGVVATNEHGYVEFMNAAAEGLTGWERAEATGMELSRVFCTEPLAGGEPLTANEAPGIREASLVRRDGRKLPVEVAAVAARDAGGRIIGFVWTFHDIAARRRAEEALREREEHYRSLIERSSEVMALIERDGSIYYVSSAVRHILGFEPTELIGCSALALIHAEDLPSLLRDPNAAGPPVRIRVRHAAGGWRTLELHLAERPERAAARFLVRASDVTEQVAAEERLARETEVAAALARAGEEMMSAMATEDLLPRLCRVTAEVLKCDFSHTWLWRPAEKEFVMVAGHGDSAEDRATLRALRVPQALLAGLLARLRTEDPVVGSMDDAMPPLPAALPRRYGIEHALYATLERGGELVGIQTAGFRRKGVHFSPVQRRIARDLARLASIALEHQRVVEELRQTSRLKSDLMDMLSHELRAPLGTLAGITALFREGAFGALTETQAERFADVDRMLREMLDLIQSTLDLSRLERHEAPLDLRTVSAESLVDGLAAARPKAGDVELAIHVPADLPPIETDPLKLRVVIENLVTNALKFTRHGSVSLMARAESGGLLFEVADTGVGIPEGKRELVFEPFRQLATSDAQQGGVGLGLYIVRRLVEMLGGRIEMESTVGVGTTFRVWIPLAPTKGRDDGLAANAPDSRLQ